MNMVILSISYLDARDNRKTWSTDPMPVETAMQQVFKLAQGGVDVINHYDTDTMEILLLHRVTGITLRPAR